MEKTISLDSDCLIEGAVGRHLLLYYVGVSSDKQGCYTQDVDTLQLERVCYSCPKQSEVYCNFPPSLLSSPTVSIVPRHTDHRGVDNAVSAPESREADPGGVEGHTGQELTDVAGVPPCKHGRRSGRSGSAGGDGRRRLSSPQRTQTDASPVVSHRTTGAEPHCRKNGQGKEEVEEEEKEKERILVSIMKTKPLVPGSGRARARVVSLPRKRAKDYGNVPLAELLLRVKKAPPP